MKVLATGMEWFDENPGGLPRYFADYTAAWNRKGGHIRALVRTGLQQTTPNRPHYVRSIFSSSQNPARVRNIWKYSLRHELRLNQYDVFNPHFAYYAWAWEALNIDMPVVTHFHGPWAYESKVEDNSTRARIRFSLQKKIEQRVYQFSDQFIVLSDSFRRVLIDNYGIPQERIHIVPGAVDINRFSLEADKERSRYSLALPQDRTILVSVRRLVRRMGLENLIRAVEALAADFPHLLLVIVGTGDTEAELRNMVSERNLEDYVWLTGRVPDDDLPKYYQSADLSIVPSVAFEGFGLITAESLACGTPVLGTPIGGTKEILSQFNENLLLPGTRVPDLVDGIGRVLSERAKWPSPEACRGYVLANHTWDAAIPRIREVFLDALTGTGSATSSHAIAATLNKEVERA